MAQPVPSDPGLVMNNTSLEEYDQTMSEQKTNELSIYPCGGQIRHGIASVIIVSDNPTKERTLKPLKQTIESLHFAVVWQNFDETKEDYDVLAVTKNNVSKNDECLFIYIEQDEPSITLEKVIDFFSPHNCPELENKPKIIVFGGNFSPSSEFKEGYHNNTSPTSIPDFFIFQWTLTKGDDAAFSEEFCGFIKRNVGSLRNHLDTVSVTEALKDEHLLTTEHVQNINHQLPENKAKVLLDAVEKSEPSTQRSFVSVLKTVQPSFYAESLSSYETLQDNHSLVSDTIQEVFNKHACNEHLVVLMEKVHKRVYASKGAYGTFWCSTASTLCKNWYFFPGIPNLLPGHKDTADFSDKDKLRMINIAYHSESLVDLFASTDDLLASMKTSGVLSKRYQSFIITWPLPIQRINAIFGVITRFTQSQWEKFNAVVMGLKNSKYNQALRLIDGWQEGKLRMKFAIDNPSVNEDWQKHLDEAFRLLLEKDSRFSKAFFEKYGLKVVVPIGDGPWMEVGFAGYAPLQQFLDDNNHSHLPHDLLDCLDNSSVLAVTYCDGRPLEDLKAYFKKQAAPSSQVDSAYASHGSTVVTEQSVSASTTRSDVYLEAMRKIIFSMIESRDYSGHDFEKLLRAKMPSANFSITDLKNERGMSILHSICEQGRQPFLACLVRMGYWTALRPLYVPHNPVERCSEKDGRQIAENVTRSRKLVVEYDEMERWEMSLNDLHKAARDGNLKNVENLLRTRQRYRNEKDHFNSSVLYWACVSGSIEVFNKLKRDVNPRASNKKNETLLHVACMMGHTHFIKTLIDCGIEKEAVDFSGKTALDYTAENGDVECFKMLLSFGVQLTKNLSLHAAYLGREKYYKMLVEHSYIGDTAIKGEHGKTALMRAAEASRLPVVKYIVSYGGVRWQECDDRKRNVLHYAADGGDGKLMEELVKGARRDGQLENIINMQDYYVGSELCFLIRGKDKGRRAWHYVEVLRNLVHSFVKKTKSGSVDVAMFGKVVKSGWGADPEDSVMSQLEERFRQRIREKENAGQNVSGDVTPLHIACFKENVEAARILLEAGADPNKQDSFNLTPLHISAMRGNVALVDLLEKYKAEVHHLSLDNKTAVQVAEENEHGTIVNFIRGKDHVTHSQEFIDFMDGIKGAFTRQKLEALRNDGRDVKRHLVDHLRDITIRVNEFLLSMGSGPVMEESAPHQQPS